MATNLKFLSATALTLCLPLVAFAPVNAKPLEQSVQQPPASLVAQVESMVGRIVSVSGTTVEVKFRNQQNQQYQVSSGDFQAWKLAQGSYVLVEGNKIVDVAYPGTIVGFAGEIFNVRLDQGGIVNTYVSRRMAGALNLRVGGTRVVIAGNQIVALWSEIESLSTVSVIRTGRADELFQERQVIAPAPLRQTEVRQNVEVQERTVETQPQKPVRGLW